MGPAWHRIAFLSVALILSAQSACALQAMPLQRDVEGQMLKGLVERAVGSVPTPRDIEATFGLKYAPPRISRYVEVYEAPGAYPFAAESAASTYLLYPAGARPQVLVSIHFASPERLFATQLPQFCLPRQEFVAELLNRNWQHQLVTDPIHDIRNDHYTLEVDGISRLVYFIPNAGDCIQTVVVRFKYL
ncbi:hypothetical protein GHT07_19700 [Caenimonas koreensis DSM 17982]|uniref:SmpA / OmlA family protein n=1 Tax=Caenimonas koreensis DSM 17982 TaxID=1121255 RepID=A0A844AZQ5_9BURK|nr:hypothetical protein [Caenimonas koreensis]MRD49504.1 hypothetical protein [Caenimonas koreensis DSM 17982]